MTKLGVFIVSRIPLKKKRRDHLAVGEDTGWRSVAGLVPGYLSYWLPWIPKPFPIQKHLVDCCGMTRTVTLEPGLKPPTLCFMLLCCIHYFFYYHCDQNPV